MKVKAAKSARPGNGAADVKQSKQSPSTLEGAAPQGMKARLEDVNAKVSSPESLLLFNTSSEGIEQTRASIASLYSLASHLHSRSLPYSTQSIQTDASSNVSSDQIWGQMRLLMQPVVRRLRESVSRAQKTLADEDPAKKSRSKKSGGNRRKRARKENGDKGDDDDDENGSAVADHEDDDDDDEDEDGDVSSVATNESELDAQIARLMEKRQNKAAKKKKKGAAASGDDWRYAFGRGDEDEEDEEDDEHANGQDGSDDDVGDVDDLNRILEEGDNEDGASARVRNRNARVMADMAEDEGMDEDEGDGDEEGDAEEALAALQEMYGEDFDEDDLDEQGGLEGSDADEDIEEMLSEEASDEREEGLDDRDTKTRKKRIHWNEDEEQAEEGLEFNEVDGKYWGKDDILNDTGDEFGDGGHRGGTHTPAGEDEDAAFEEELANNHDLTDLQRERLREQRSIGKMEEERVFGTSKWAMGGEVGANKRPMDSLLDEQLDFEHGMKAVPVITEQTTANLEERIKRRVLSKNFNDVQRVTKMTNAGDLVTTKRDAALESQKSKMSLMDLYEKDYLDKMKRAEEAAGIDAPSAEPLTEIEKDELRTLQMWKRLSQHLDALSNYFFTPKPVQMDLEARVRAVENQAPAITIETAGQFAATREAALAPQDLYRPAKHKFADVGSNELDPRERRALRRAKKESSKATNERKEQQKEAAKKKYEDKVSKRQQEKEAAQGSKGRKKKPVAAAAAE